MFVSRFYRVLLASLFLTNAAVTDASNGSGPNGKPFIELQGQIIEVQSDFSSLEEDFEAIKQSVQSLDLDLQGQIDALSGEIDALKQTDIDLKSSLEQAILDLVAQGTDISNLMSALSQVNLDLIELGGAVGDNTQALADLEAQKSQILDDLAALDAGLVAAISDISDNKSLINMLEDEVQSLEEGKQDKIVGSCPSGTSVTAVNENGSLMCGTTDGGENIVHWTLSDIVTLNNYRNEWQECVEWLFDWCIDYETRSSQHYDGATLTLNCPFGFTVISAGYELWNYSYGFSRNTADIQKSYPIDSRSWYFSLMNVAPGTNFVSTKLYVNCLSI